MSWIAGVDGCRGGWFVVTAELTGNNLAGMRHVVCQTFQGVLSIEPEPDVICVDIPIGLLDETRYRGRVCDELARNMLRGRKSSVFSSPTRSQSAAVDYDQARHFGGISQQAFGICPKIHEVDLLMRPELQSHVLEIHPELSFYGLAGVPMSDSKKSPRGVKQRKEHLAALFPDIAEAVTPQIRGGLVQEDDILDAYAALATAWRRAQNNARRVPADPPLDSRGLRMEMWY